jgi:uncharacterized protein (TIGR02001 family)
MAFSRSAAFSVVVLLFGGIADAQQSEPDLRVSFLIGSDYKHNGLSLTNSDPTLRLVTDYEHPSGFFAGGFLTNVDFAAEEYFRKPREIEANLYAGYAWRGRNWATNVSVARYLYPDLIISYDYTQFAANFSFKDTYFFGVTRSTDYLSIYRDSYQYRGGIVLPTALNLEVGINAGRSSSSGILDIEYSFWDVGVSRALGQYALDLRYHGNDYDGTSLIGESGSDRWVFSVAIAIVPRERRRELR